MAPPTESERRSFPRHAPLRTEAWLAWDEPEGLAAVQATLRDISVGGAALILGGRPPGVESVRVKLAGVNNAEWTPAFVEKIQEAPGQVILIRLRFLGDCPFNLFRAALLPTADEHDHDEPDHDDHPPSPVAFRPHLRLAPETAASPLP